MHDVDVDVFHTQEVYSIIEALENFGYNSYLVGGAVRDLLLGQQPNDYDIATSATPEQVREVFRDTEYWKVIPTGIAHGTVTCYSRLTEECYEITTFRKDVSTDGRNATIEFSNNIVEDLSRRDFTINAIAIGLNNEIVDPFNGEVDLKNKLIVTVGTSARRFREDYLRMFRAYRLSSQLEFTVIRDIHNDIEQIVSESNKWVNRLSAERIKQEFDKCFTKSRFPAGFLQNLVNSGIMEVIMPEVSRCVEFEQNRFHEYDVFTHTLFTINNIPKDKPLVRWAALFHDLGKYDTREGDNKENYTFHEHHHASVKHAKNIMDRLKFSNEEKEHIINLIRYHMVSISEDMPDKGIRKIISKVGLANMEDFISLKLADSIAKGKTNNPVREIMSVFKHRVNIATEHENKAFSTNDLAINGNDVMEVLGWEPGPDIGKMLRFLFDCVLDNPDLNNRETLINLIKKIKIYNGG